MATGNQSDILGRLQRLMPNGWFAAGMVPIRDAVLTGAANALSFIYGMLAYVRQQTRIATATDGFLDLIAFDFFGNDLSRAPGQTDASFRNQIIAFLFRERNTRKAVNDVIVQLLGTTPTIIEPMRLPDCGSWDGDFFAWDTAGIIGDTAMPLQFFVDVDIPYTFTLAPPSVGGFDDGVGAFDTGSQLEFIGPPAVDPVLVNDVEAAIVSVLPVCGVAWINVLAIAPPVTPPPPSTSVTFDSTVVDFSETTVSFDSD